MFFFLGAAVFNQTLYYVPVHQRFSAEKVYFQMLSVAGIGNEEIKGFLSYLIAH